MPALALELDTRSDAFAANRTHTLALIDEWRRVEARTRAASAKAAPLFERRGQLLPRERVARLLDPGVPFLELSTLAGWRQDVDDAERSVAGGGAIAGIGVVSGVRVLVLADDSGIDAGALQAQGLEKVLRAQQIALDNKLPFVHLVESAGANLLKYRVEQFVRGGALFCNLARLSAAGLPVIAIVHGSSTAGGAYMTGLADHVIMVRGRARAFLAGPPLLKAATGEVATDEALGGADMHAAVSGLAEHVADDDASALAVGRALVAAFGWQPCATWPDGPPPRFDAEELLGVFGADAKKPVDMRHVIARIVDASDFLEFKAEYGPGTVCGHAAIAGFRVGIITNNGPLDPAGSTKVTHFVQACCQVGQPIVWLQNTTGFIVGTEAERAGMIKHGSKQIQALANATVPQLTIHCGASFGAGNYGMCGRAFGPRFVFSWPTAKTAVMGAEQAAGTMEIVMREGAVRKGEAVDETRLAALKAQITSTFERQSGAFHTSGLLLDDGLIDPRDTRRVLALALAVCDEAARRTLRPMQFGVARP
ncbi:MAG TPA: carboxyl transferase domain-containing protein [Caldimonas sp.]|nr:carboxyl transferase domain-containing protein [Caldimonas sp.]HEX4233731.1 carboxyl transferase domain-containing protein [Caldimonas sp.]